MSETGFIQKKYIFKNKIVIISLSFQLLYRMCRLLLIVIVKILDRIVPNLIYKRK